MDTPRKHNFFAGPAVLPVSALKKAQEAIDSGRAYEKLMQYIDISHKIKAAVKEAPL